LSPIFLLLEWVEASVHKFGSIAEQSGDESGLVITRPDVLLGVLGSLDFFLELVQLVGLDGLYKGKHGDRGEEEELKTAWPYGASQGLALKV
jgi:hypothetical protein